MATTRARQAGVASRRWSLTLRLNPSIDERTIFPSARPVRARVRQLDRCPGSGVTSQRAVHLFVRPPATPGLVWNAGHQAAASRGARVPGRALQPRLRAVSTLQSFAHLDAHGALSDHDWRDDEPAVGGSTASRVADAAAFSEGAR